MNVLANTPTRLMRSRLMPESIRRKRFWDKVAKLTAEEYEQMGRRPNAVVYGSNFIGELMAIGTFYGFLPGDWKSPAYAAWQKEITDQVWMLLYEIDRGLL